MLFHTMVGSNDIERSKRFYDTVLGTLGAGEGTRNIADSGHIRLIYNNGNGTNFIVSQPINDEPASVANGSDVTPDFHPAATRDRPVLSRRSAGDATGGVNPARCLSSSAANAAGVV